MDKSMIQDVLAKLEFANVVMNSNSKIPLREEWKAQEFNQRYFSHKKSKRQYLIPRDARALQAAESLLRLRPYVNLLAKAFYANPNNPDQEERLKTANHALALGLLDCVITDMFFEPTVSRYGLSDRWGKDYVLEWDFDYSLIGAAKWAEYQYDHKLFKNGFSPLRTWGWQFGIYDEYRIFWEEELK